MNKRTIGVNAGIIWKLLNSNNEKMTIEKLCEASGLLEKNVLIALGWLAREDRVEIEENDNNDDFYFIWHHFF